MIKLIQCFCLFFAIIFGCLTMGTFSVRLGDVHTSAAQMLQLVETEARVVASLQSYLASEEKKLEVIRSYVDEWTGMEPSGIVENPLNSYHFLRRVSEQFEEVQTVIQRKTSEKISKDLKAMHSGLHMPVESDVNGAAWALVRLQDVYNLTLDDLVNGSFSGTHATKGLTAEDCLRFGQQSFQNLEFDLSNEWTNKAIEMMRQERPLTISRKQKIEQIKTMVTKREMMRGLVTKLAQKSEEEVVERFSGLGIPTSFQRKIHTSPGDNKLLTTLDNNYRSLCRGETAQNEIYFNGLVCTYMRGKSSYHLLMPFKIELIWPDPIMVMYHDVLSDKEIQMIMDIAFPRLYTTQVHSFTNHNPMKSLARVGKTAWVRSGDSVGVDRILQRIEHMTGLSTKSAEDFHVLNYGIGGHYDVHVDFFDLLEKQLDTEVHQGDRLATVLFYMNDVEAGGATVFPTLDIRVVPKKGSALVWFNLKRSGFGDYRTAHASCPVLLGHKWIANLWLHSYHQEFLWPCKLDPEE